MAWDNILNPRNNGGLGIKSTRHLNIAFMMKLGWELIARRDKLWVRIVRAKYGCGNSVIPNVVRRNIESNVWRGIRNAWKFVLRGVKWHIGDGLATNFWKDSWLTNEPLIVQVGNVSQDVNLDRIVNSYVDVDGD